MQSKGICSTPCFFYAIKNNPSIGEYQYNGLGKGASHFARRVNNYRSTRQLAERTSSQNFLNEQPGNFLQTRKAGIKTEGFAQITD